jgi:hypothetical protein
VPRRDDAASGRQKESREDKHNLIFGGKQDDDYDLSAAPAFVTASDSSSMAGAHASGIASASGESSASAPFSVIELVHSPQAVVCSRNSSTLPLRPNSRNVWIDDSGTAL